MRRAVFLALTLLILASIIPIALAQEYSPPHEKPGPAVDRILFVKRDQDLAPKLVEQGDIDLYLFNLRVSTAYEYLRSEKVRIYEAPSSMVSILVNPAPAPEEELNPFSLPEVRRAVQYLIDREYVAEEIYRGFAVPMYSHVSPLDYDYLVVARILKEMGIRYDPDYAKELITEAMEEAGAELMDGKWSYGGKLIVLKFIIRVEDERREIGNMLAEELERMGFTVHRLYMDFAQAIALVYGTDPAAFEWHLYTEGWGRTAVERYDYATLNQMCAPWLGNMPGWLEVGFWQYENKRLDELGQRLFKGEYSGLAERNRLYAEATKLCVEESIRAWVVTVNNALPARVDLEGVSMDVVSGLRSLWTLRSTYVKGGELKVGHLWVRPFHGSAWNPVGGFTDVYSVDVWRNIRDPPIWRHPSTGIPTPFRAEYEVETAGPDGYLDVPGNAFRWDAEKGRWVKVGAGVKARSKVIFDYGRYLNSSWHHGPQITWADILYAIYQRFDLTYNPEKSEIEVAIAVTSKPILETFKGFRIIDDAKLEVYVDYWHFDENYIAEYAEPWGAPMPWEVLYAMDVLVFEERKAAYSDTASARLQVDWLSLIEENTARRLIRIMREAMEVGVYPENVFRVRGEVYSSLDDAEERYKAAEEWFREHGHLVIGNGPFYLDKIGTVAEQYAELKAFRDPNYPFTPKDFYVGMPETIEVKAPLLVETRPGEDTRIEVEAVGPGELSATVLLLDPITSEIVYEADARRSDEGFEALIPGPVTSGLGVGSYKLYLITYSDATSLVAEAEIDLEIVEKPEVTVTETEATATTTPSPPPEKPGDQTMLLLVAAVALAIAVGASLAFRRRRR